MYKEGKIRVLALGLIRDTDNRTLLSEGYDPIKKDKFYRALGGGVEFGETSLEALQREFQEEIQAELTNIRYLSCLENIFTFQGNPGHEIIQLYQCDLADPKFYQLETIPFNEGEREKTALWVDIKDLKSGNLRLVPEGFVDYLG
ncbi:MAG: NUDIX hydrolase [Cyanobacteriota bacterium]|nr:NUDIX hydrolase [Cyanobacteriota bacterium]